MKQIPNLDFSREVINPTGKSSAGDQLIVDRLRVPGGWIVLVHLLVPAVYDAPGFINTTSQFIADPAHEWIDTQEAS